MTSKTVGSQTWAQMGWQVTNNETVKKYKKAPSFTSLGISTIGTISLFLQVRIGFKKKNKNIKSVLDLNRSFGKLLGV